VSVTKYLFQVKTGCCNFENRFYKYRIKYLLFKAVKTYENYYYGKMLSKDRTH